MSLSHQSPGCFPRASLRRLFLRPHPLARHCASPPRDAHVCGRGVALRWMEWVGRKRGVEGLT